MLGTSEDRIVPTISTMGVQPTNLEVIQSMDRLDNLGENSLRVTMIRLLILKIVNFTDLCSGQRSLNTANRIIQDNSKSKHRSNTTNQKNDTVIHKKPFRLKTNPTFPTSLPYYRQLSSGNFRKIIAPEILQFRKVHSTIVPANSVRGLKSQLTIPQNFPQKKLESFVADTILGHSIQPFIISNPQANIPSLVVCPAVICSVSTHGQPSLSYLHSTIYYRQMQEGIFKKFLWS